MAQDPKLIELEASLFPHAVMEELTALLDEAGYEPMLMLSTHFPIHSKAKVLVLDWSRFNSDAATEEEFGKLHDQWRNAYSVEPLPDYVVGLNRDRTLFSFEGQSGIETKWLTDHSVERGAEILFSVIDAMMRSESVELAPPTPLIIATGSAYSEELLLRLARDWDHIHTLTPRQFEELIAEMLTRDGFEVELTKQTRDGGIDLFAREQKQFGKVVYAYELKLYRPDRPIGVSIVRQFATAKVDAGVGIGVLCTTSTFSKDALGLSQRHVIYPQDRLHLHEWIKQSAERERKR